MEEEKNPVLEEIEKEIEETKARNTGEFEIEIADEPPETEQKEKVEKAPEPEKAPTAEYGAKVQRRIRTLIKEKKEAEELAQKQAQESADLKARLVKLESQSQQNVNKDFQTQYDQTKQALHTAVEEGDTKAQVEFSEQLADMRARIRRAIDVQLDLEGFDKNSSDYYINLNSRLQKIYPELISSDNVTQPKTRAKSSNIVTPSTGGSSYKGNRVRMTQDQLRMARELGINDEAGLKKYAQEIQKSQRS